ncbi:MAG: hypothetical protein NTX15_09550 [Candidatus Kapabacteria bacterium]|nr:hypothetical protein [Candidatus Kapabacteria bacterium]
MVISRADQGAVQSRLQTLYGSPNGLDPASPSWMMDDQVAVSIADADGGLTVTFNLLTLELLQYMDK